MNIADRFWSKVSLRAPEDCWPWTASASRHGYGAFSVGRSMRVASRMAYELAHNTAVPRHLDVMHSCDNRLCCNPAHLSVGTRGDNMRDCSAKDRTTFGERAGSAKLDEATVRLIPKLMATGLFTQVSLGKLLGVRGTAICRILSGQRWRRTMLAAATAALVGCGASLPSETMTRFAETLEATKHAYLALCGGREESPECVSILESVNVAISTYTSLNDQLKD